MAEYETAQEVDELRKELKKIREEMRALRQEFAGDGGDGCDGAGNRWAAFRDLAASRLRDLKDKSDAAVKTARDKVTERPLTSLAVALAAGLIVGRLLPRGNRALNALIDFLLAVLDVFEAEGRALRGGLDRLIIRRTLYHCVGLLAVGGVGLLVWALYSCLAPPLGTPWAALICGLTLFGVATLAAGVARWLVR